MKGPFIGQASIDPAVLAAKASFEREAREQNGYSVSADCPACYSPMFGLVMLDGGETQTFHSPGKPARAYCVGFARSCNCDSPTRQEIEEALVYAAETNEAYSDGNTEAA